MDIDEDKVDDAVLALLWLTRCGETRAWKGHDRDAMGRLFEKGMIGDPKSKARSVWFTEEGLAESERLFNRLFGKGSEE